MSTYLTGKIGKSIKFNEKCWGAVGGDNELPTLILSIARNNPDDNFIIIGKNDIERYDKAPSNLVSVKSIYENKFGSFGSVNLPITYIYDALDGIKVDGCFLNGGPTGAVNLPDFAYRRRDLANGIKTYASSLEMHKNYSGPIYHFLNTTMIPWVLMMQDPRYLKMGRDCLNPPQKVLSQYNETFVYKYLKSKTDQLVLNEKSVQCTYNGLEKIFLINKDITAHKKDIDFLIVLNEGLNGVKSRYRELKKYILNDFDTVDIYGKWAHEDALSDDRFKGSLKFTELQEKLKRVKYTFIIPIKPGWVTMKYWEMIGNGVIPFLHPDYDTQNHLNAPNFLRVKTGKELKSRIDILESNPEAYEKMLKILQGQITQDDYNGSILSKTIIENTPVIKNLGTQDFKTDYDFKSIDSVDLSEFF